MKISTIKYIVKEGIVNAYKNKVMSIASVCIVASSLIMFGIFFLLTININYNSKQLETQQDIVVICKYELDESQVKQVANEINGIKHLDKIQIVTKKEALEKMKQQLGDSPEILEELNEDFLPVCFNIRVNHIENCNVVVDQLKAIRGIKSVRYSAKEVEILTNIVHTVQIGSIFLILILIGVSMFIISNTIKMAVFARKSEIRLMKYIGATNWFVRWPFVIEGIVIGALGSLIAFVLMIYGYSSIIRNIPTQIGFLTVIDLRNSMKILGPLFFFIGILVGAASSLFSVRRHLKV